MSIIPIIIIFVEFLAYHAGRLLIIRNEMRADSVNSSDSDTKKKRVNPSDSHSELDDVFLNPSDFHSELDDFLLNPEKFL